MDGGQQHLIRPFLGTADKRHADAFPPTSCKRPERAGRLAAFERVLQGRNHMSRVLAIAALCLVVATGPVAAHDKSIVVASTTSTQDSALFGHNLPMFKAKTGIDAKVVAQGTGQALDTGRRGDADVLFVHAKPQEEKFVADGFGVQRFDVMYNDFVLIGPKADPAGVKGGNDVVAALTRISEKAAPFVSRGDKSGTHAAELALWKLAALDPAGSKPGWYREIGQGMGAALNTSAAMGAYVLADRGTWISFKNKEGLEIVVEGDKRLFNQYGIMLVNPAKHPSVKKEFGQAFIDWIISAEGQNAIRSYKIQDQQLFFPNADAGQMKKAG
jgi:tungstate transport system substrate-binding protein